FMTQIHYTVSVPDPNSHLLRVRMEVHGLPGDSTDFVMPAWTPGSYKVRDYAKNVQDFSAGRKPWRKIDKSRWRVAAGGEVTVEYDVWAFELSVQSSHVDADHAFLNGASIFFYVDGHKDAPLTIDFKIPRGWRIASGLERRGRSLAAPDYDVLVDSPIEIGTFTKRTFKVGGIDHHLVIHGEANYDEKQMVQDVRRIVETEVRILRHIPYPHYTFFLHNAAERGGGLEHLNSTALQFPSQGYKPREKYENFLELVAHEFFHLWNVKRIHPDMLGPFDYEREVYTTLLWVMEGFTSYYDTIIPCRAKLFTPDKYFKKMADRIQKYEEKPGRKRQSLSASSFDTWIKLYQPNENSTNCQMSYYEKGELVGMCLDLEIRHRTGNRKSLDDVMRALYKDYGRAGEGFPEVEFKRTCEKFAGSLDRFFRDWVDGVADIPWNRFLGYAGVEYLKDPRKPDEGEAARKARAWLGVGTAKSGGVLSIANVLEDAPAWKAGLSAKDELIAIDGIKLGPDDFERRLDEYAPGDRARLTIFRSGYLRELPVTFGSKENVTWAIRRVKSPSALEKKIYEGWLWNRWEAAKKK
ncbi:MAG TPA: PDZ domain-containing protein, partial [Planctomycetota bacterium]|nr:PDZ domain-containing protein [Planctomycetota bacterium]